MNKPIMKGKVYLMGAGPGDPDLLTVQAVRVLRAAEVVLHDHLVATAILDLIPAWTQVRNVGKRCGSTSFSQEQIHSLLISAARKGHQVVRLKGGDPLLFGRVGEEMEALAKAGIDFEVIPGVTAAMGVAAAAKIPLTDRRYASKLVFVSNHSADNAPPNWGDVISSDATHVVYMPGTNYAEIEAKLSAGGLDRRTPCLIVTHATRPEQQMRRITLQELALEPGLPAPALLIIGEVARPLPPLQDDEKTSSQKTTKPHEEILHLTDAPASPEINV
jgi:uroporphyrin-III C-methyltransferase